MAAEGTAQLNRSLTVEVSGHKRHDMGRTTAITRRVVALAHNTAPWPRGCFMHLSCAMARASAYRARSHRAAHNYAAKPAVTLYGLPIYHVEQRRLAGFFVHPPADMVFIDMNIRRCHGVFIITVVGGVAINGEGLI